MENCIQLKDLTPVASTVNVRFILIEKGEIIKEDQDKTKTCIALVGDETACVNFQMLGAECEVFEPGDIIHISNGIFSRRRNKLVLWVGESGVVEKVGEFTMLFVESPNMSKEQFLTDATHSSELVPESEHKEMVKDEQKVTLAEKPTQEALDCESKDNKDEAREKEVEEDDDAQKKKDAERDERAKKSVSVTNFLKPAEAERYYGGDSGHGNRGPGQFRGG